MDDSPGVRLGERRASLAQVHGRVPWRDRPAYDDVGQVFAGQVFHDNEGRAAGKAPEVEHARDVLGREARAGLRFPQEPHGRAGVAASQDLYGDAMAELDV